MNQQVTIRSTKARNRRRPKSFSGGGVSHSMISAKPSNIPLPTESEDNKNNLVNWGNENQYPYFLNYLFKNNPIHAGIIRAKRYFTVAGGLEYEGANEEGYKAFFKNKKKSHRDKDLTALVSDISLDYEKSNLGCFKVLFTKVGDKKYKKLEVIPFEKIRYEIIKDDDGDVFLSGKILVSEDWLEANPEFDTLSAYEPHNDEQRECFVLFQEESGQSLDDPKSREVNPGVYPDPPYGGAITAIDTGIQVGVHDNSEIHNGFVLGTMMYFANGKFKNEDEKRKFEQDLGASATGPTQSGRILATYGNGQDQKPEVIPLNGNNLPDRYNNTKTGSESSVMHGHSVVAPALFGVKPDGSFNASELETGYAIMQANYFEARRNEILSTLNWIMNVIAEIEGAISFGEIVLQLEQQASDEGAGAELNKMSPLVATKVLSQMTPNEIRSLAKLDPVEGGDELPSNEPAAFSKEDSDNILARLQDNGLDRDAFNILCSVSLEDGELSKEEMLDTIKDTFAELSDIHQQALNLINEGQGYNSIRKALDISGIELTRIYQDLAAQELITDKGETTSAGKKQVAVSEVASMEIMFEYRIRPEFNEAIIPGTRDFCRTLLSLNRLYTREDISRISGVEGYNVFAYRGGWYHNPNSGKNEPGCRHEWAQVITFK